MFTTCNFNCLQLVNLELQLVMADDIFKWIRNISALNDEQLKQEIDLVHQSSIKDSFTTILFEEPEKMEVNRKVF